MTYSLISFICDSQKRKSTVAEITSVFIGVCSVYLQRGMREFGGAGSIPNLDYGRGCPTMHIYQNLLKETFKTSEVYGVLNHTLVKLSKN